MSAVYDFAKEAHRLCDAIGSGIGWMTVQCALREAFAAGASGEQQHEAELDRAADRLRTFVREHKHGGCKMFWQGSACQCPLCDVNRLVDAIHERHQGAAGAEMTNGLNEIHEQIKSARSLFRIDVERAVDRARAFSVAMEMAIGEVSIDEAKAVLVRVFTEELTRRRDR